VGCPFQQTAHQFQLGPVSEKEGAMALTPIIEPLNHGM
jgi:hypothetical protein